MTTRQLFLAAACVSAALAQNVTAPTPPTDQVKTYLSLTDAQIQSLQSIRQQESQALSSLRQQIMQKQNTLAQQMQNGSTDATTMGNLLVDIVNLQKQLSQQQSTYHTQAVAVLTTDQQTKLQALQSAASLAPAVRQAEGLLLVTPPSGGPGMGPGFGPGFGPGGAGPQGRFQGRRHAPMAAAFTGGF
ncbi:MAG TPA: periplasmic heavy metal sensor [Bryobacteraceae bacterium]|nr:periplasmic heavy metal sensor [Bryobacteraceae bacterium]